MPCSDADNVFMWGILEQINLLCYKSNIYMKSTVAQTRLFKGIQMKLE